MKNILLLILLPALLPGQNSQMVADYLGQTRFEKGSPPAGKVVFDFSVVPIERTANGRQTYADLLKKGQFVESGNYGTLTGVFVTEGGQLVKVPRAQKKQAAAMQPIESVGGPASSFSLPDSADFARGAEGFRTGADIAAKKAAPIALIVWDNWMYLFWNYIIFVLLTLAAVLWYVAYVSSSESLASMRGWVVAGRAFVAAHTWSAFLLAGVIGVIALTLILSVCIWAWKTGSLLLFCVTVGATMWTLARLTTKWIPNLPVAGTRSANRYTGGSNGPGLNSGI